MTTTTDVTMARRFREIPARGIVPDEPLVGWRLERVDRRGNLFNVSRSGRIEAEPCSRALKSFIPVPQLRPFHTAPHGLCECGVRLVGSLGSLSEFWSNVFRLITSSGVGLEDRFSTPDVVLARFRSEGEVFPGHDMPYDDPLGTIRVGAAELIEVFFPPWVDPAKIQGRHLGVPVQPVEAVAVGRLFEPLRRSGPPQTTLAYQSLKHHLRVVTGVADVRIPRTYVQPAAVRDAVWGTVSSRWGGSEHIATLVNRLVIPLTDLDNPVDMTGCAFGFAVGLAMLSDESVEIPKWEGFER